MPLNANVFSLKTTYAIRPCDHVITREHTCCSLLNPIPRIVSRTAFGSRHGPLINLTANIFGPTEAIQISST